MHDKKNKHSQENTKYIQRFIPKNFNNAMRDFDN